MNSLKEWRLSKENKGIRRLIWVLQVKQNMPRHYYRGRQWFNMKRDRQVIILKKEGYTFRQICGFAELYECLGEVFN